MSETKSDGYLRFKCGWDMRGAATIMSDSGNVCHACEQRIPSEYLYLEMGEFSASICIPCISGVLAKQQPQPQQDDVTEPPKADAPRTDKEAVKDDEEERNNCGCEDAYCICYAR